MRACRFIFGVFLLAGGIHSAAQEYAEANIENIKEYKSTVEATEHIDLINNVYAKFVFATEPGGDNHPEDFFTDNALKKLQNDYGFDCEIEACYAYYDLRTTAQDSRPGSDGVSRILTVEPTDDGWYLVSYEDMGWMGKTRVKIVDGKIDMYERVVQ